MATARYIKEGNTINIKVDDIRVIDYETIYKGNLYCPTSNCSAKVVYCGGEKPHFRTWQKNDHNQTCIHQFERIPINKGISTEGNIGVDISFKRRQNAMKEAFKLMTMTEEEKQKVAQKKVNTPSKRSSPKTEGKESSAKIKSTLIGGDVREEESNGQRGRNLSKRYVDRIANSDIGEIRLIMGELTHVDVQNPTAKLTVEWGGQRIFIVFEEAFEKEPSNRAYLNNFRAIEKLLKDNEMVYFTGVGEIRKNRHTEDLELVVYIGTDLSFNNLGMLQLIALQKGI